MIYLKSVNETNTELNDDRYTYFGIEELSGLFFGTPFLRERHSFDKYTDEVREELFGLNNDGVIFEKYRRQPTGVCLRFKIEKTDRFILKAELKRRFCYNNMPLFNSSGFDIFSFKDGRYKHKNVIAPVDGRAIFAHKVKVEDGENIAIFFPNYNEVLNFYIGIDNGWIRSAERFSAEKPVVFYGNSITQGASAGRSGNSFCNIVSRKMDTEVINFSLSNCCRGLLTVADAIGQVDCSAVVIDYSRNSFKADELEERLHNFYKRIRAHHANIPIIMMTASFFGNVHYGFMDEAILRVFKKNSEDNLLYLLNQRELFDASEYDLISVDGIHYNDMGMLRIADRIISILEKKI